MPENKSYGRTKSGVEITDELIEQYVAEAEEGLDLDKLRPRGDRGWGLRRRSRSRCASTPTCGLRSTSASEHDGRPASEVVREALRRYLEAG